MPCVTTHALIEPCVPPRSPASRARTSAPPSISDPRPASQEYSFREVGTPATQNSDGVRAGHRARPSRRVILGRPSGPSSLGASRRPRSGLAGLTGPPGRPGSALTWWPACTAQFFPTARLDRAGGCAANALSQPPMAARAGGQHEDRVGDSTTRPPRAGRRTEPQQLWRASASRTPSAAHRRRGRGAAAYDTTRNLRDDRTPSAARRDPYSPTRTAA